MRYLRWQPLQLKNKVEEMRSAESKNSRSLYSNVSGSEDVQNEERGGEERENWKETNKGDSL